MDKEIKDFVELNNKPEESKKFKKRIRIEDAESFKLQYYNKKQKLTEREFSSYEMMEQFDKRQKDYLYLPLQKYISIEGVWHKFIKLTSLFVFEKELNHINNIFNEKFEE